MSTQSITPEMIWEGYRALHRYVAAAPSVMGAKPPKRISERPYRENIQECDSLSVLLSRLYDTGTPLLVDPAYFTYLYLFVQLLRCSYKALPFYLENRGWMNLGWFPLRTLRGRLVDGEPVPATRAWHGWVAKHSRTSEQELRAKYPWFEDDVAASLAAVDAQLRALMQLSVETASLPLDVLRHLSPAGYPQKTGASSGWHPMFLLSRVDSWVPDATSTDPSLIERNLAGVSRYLNAILTNRRLGNLFIEKFIPAANLDASPDLQEHLKIIRDGLDNLIEKKLPSRAKLWMLLRKRVFPPDDLEP